MSTLLEAVTLPTWLDTLLNAVTNVIAPILILVATAGIIYAVVVGVKFVRAEDKSQRDEAKAKLISVIVGIVVTCVLIALFYFLSAAFRNGWIKFNDWYDADGTLKGANVGSTFRTVAGVVKSFFVR